MSESMSNRNAISAEITRRNIAFEDAIEGTAKGSAEFGSFSLSQARQLQYIAEWCETLDALTEMLRANEAHRDKAGGEDAGLTWRDADALLASQSALIFQIQGSLNRLGVVL